MRFIWETKYLFVGDLTGQLTGWFIYPPTLRHDWVPFEMRYLLHIVQVFMYVQVYNISILQYMT